MRLLSVLVSLLCLFTAARGADRVFDFSETEEGKTPAGFTNVLAGFGQPGDWRIVMEDVPPTLKPLTASAPNVTRRPVLAQKSRSLVDAHYPILLFDGDTYGDFKFTTRFKIVAGEVEQMAGMVFRFKDPKNFYVLRASVKDGTLRFYKMNEGNIEKLYGPSVAFELGKWYELAVECKGNQIQCYLDGKEAIPMLTDNGFPSGKLGFWTKSDSVAYFNEARVHYTPREAAAQTFVRDSMRRYSRLVGLKIVMVTGTPPEPRIVGSKVEAELGQPADKASRDVLQTGRIFYGKERDVAHVTMPLRDRNGETIAAVKVSLDSFPGQTEQNAIIRAQPVVKEIQLRVQSAVDLIE